MPSDLSSKRRRPRTTLSSGVLIGLTHCAAPDSRWGRCSDSGRQKIAVGSLIRLPCQGEEVLTRVTKIARYPSSEEMFDPAMGLYPLAPGRAELLIASPLFPRIVVHRANGVTLTLDAANAAASTPYVQGLSVNGVPTTKPWLPESFATTGDTLSFTLGTTPDTGWGSAPADAPPSFDTGTRAPTNLALGRPASGSVSCNGNETADKAVNGSVSAGSSDKFCSAAAVKYLQVDLGRKLALGSVVVRHAGAGGESAGWNTRDFDVRVSDDGATWSTAVQVRGNTANVSTHAVSVSGRYVRIDVLAGEQSGNAVTRVYEVEVYQ